MSHVLSFDVSQPGPDSPLPLLFSILRVQRSADTATTPFSAIPSASSRPHRADRQRGDQEKDALGGRVERRLESGRCCCEPIRGIRAVRWTSCRSIDVFVVSSSFSSALPPTDTLTLSTLHGRQISVPTPPSPLSPSEPPATSVFGPSRRRIPRRSLMRSPLGRSTSLSPITRSSSCTLRHRSSTSTRSLLRRLSISSVQRSTSTSSRSPRTRGRRTRPGSGSRFGEFHLLPLLGSLFRL